MLHISDWELILAEWISEANSIGDTDRANKMRSTYCMLKALEQKGSASWQARRN